MVGGGPCRAVVAGGAHVHREVSGACGTEESGRTLRAAAHALIGLVGACSAQCVGVHSSNAVAPCRTDGGDGHTHGGARGAVVARRTAPGHRGIAEALAVVALGAGGAGRRGGGLGVRIEGARAAGSGSRTACDAVVPHGTGTRLVSHGASGGRSGASVAPPARGAQGANRGQACGGTGVAAGTRDAVCGVHHACERVVGACGTGSRRRSPQTAVVSGRADGGRGHAGARAVEAQRTTQAGTLALRGVVGACQAVGGR